MCESRDQGALNYIRRVPIKCSCHCYCWSTWWCSNISVLVWGFHMHEAVWEVDLNIDECLATKCESSNPYLKSLSYNNACIIETMYTCWAGSDTLTLMTIYNYIISLAILLWGMAYILNAECTIWCSYSFGRLIYTLRLLRYCLKIISTQDPGGANVIQISV